MKETGPHMPRAPSAQPATRISLRGATRIIPILNIKFLTVPEGKKNGLAVWRLETIRTETPHGRKDVDRIGRLVEFLPASPANAQALFGAFVGGA